MVLNDRNYHAFFSNFFVRKVNRVVKNTLYTQFNANLK